MFISEAVIKRNQPSVLDTLTFMESDERFNSAALVPIVENTNRNGYMIDLNDIFTFAEAQNIEDLGYATSLICESSQINPNEVIFSIDETAIIADDTIASLVEGMLSNGINVYAKPLSEDHPVSILGEAYLDHFFETGDMSLLESFLTGEDEILNEYTLSEYKKSYKDKLYDLVAERRKKAGDSRSIEEIKNDMKQNKDLMKHHAYWKKNDSETWGSNGKKLYKRYRRSAGMKAAGPLNKRDEDRAEFAKTITQGVKPSAGSATSLSGLYAPGITNGEKYLNGTRSWNPIVDPTKTKPGNPSDIKVEKHSGGGARPAKPAYDPNNTPSTPKGGFSLNLKEPKVYKSDTSKTYKVPEGAKKDEENIKNMADGSKWTNKPKEWYAAAIAWLHRKAKEFNDKLEKDGDNAPFWRKLIGYITRAIENLTAKKKAAA